MRITFYAHACFRVENDEIAIVTDPYTPGPTASNFEPINEPADLVITSSDDDPFHSDTSHVNGNPTTVNALNLPDSGSTVAGVHIVPYRVSERARTRPDGSVKIPSPCAMYSFELDGIKCCHMGDLGTPLDDVYIGQLRDKVDVLFALAGDVATISLADLDMIIARIRPKIVIPMHYYSPRGVLDIFPVTEFASRWPGKTVHWVDASHIEIHPDSLPETMQIHILEQSR